MAERKREGRLGSSLREFPRRDVEDEEEEEEEVDPVQERERKGEALSSRSLLHSLPSLDFFPQTFLLFIFSLYIFRGYTLSRREIP